METQSHTQKNIDIEFGEISKKWLIASLGAIPVSLQCISYLCYKAFFYMFQVRPEEAGYDFSSLLGRQAAATLVASTFILFALALLTIMIVYFGHYLMAIPGGELKVPKFAKSRFPALAALEGNIVDTRLIVVIFVATIASLPLIVAEDDRLATLCIPAIAAVFFVDAVISRRGSNENPSAWARLTAPRLYGAGRMAFLFGALHVAFLTWNQDEGWISQVGRLAFVVVGVYGLERALFRASAGTTRPSVPIKARPPIVFTGIAAVASAGIFATMGMDTLTKLPAMRDAIVKTERGDGYISEPFHWSSLLVPDTFPVLISWSGSSQAPDPLSRGVERPAVLLGQANEVTTVWLPDQKKSMRLPSASLSIVSRDPSPPIRQLN